MHIAEPTKEMIAEWQKLYNENLPSMKANRKTGIDTESGYFQIESENMKLMEEIYDDLFLFRGLDECDLNNYFLVAEYVQILNR